ncbi:hypothetical protein [Methanogenium organophilum]|uniref:Uncharacterized protein n=1 Tax=Methanogenium organophilum TaxID=2199 RepID=A0A9X9S5S2_METOG|nr:hypothetical protein [Methanogenium organophilum]WAI02237.1 hypothetical protein OU421_05035 [Methanogenium organophilum]
MADNRISLLVLSLLFLGIVVSTGCGCTEIGSEGDQAGNTVSGEPVTAQSTDQTIAQPTSVVLAKNENAIVTGVVGEVSALDGSGDVYGMYDSNDEGNVSIIVCIFRLSIGKEPVDFRSVQCTLSTSDSVEVLDYSAASVYSELMISPGEWTAFDTHAPDTGHDDLLLEDGDRFIVYVKPPHPLTPDTEFKLELSPSTGLPFEIQGIVPMPSDQ